MAVDNSLNSPGLRDRQRGAPPPGRRPWLGRTVLGIGAASFFSDVSHETATALLPLLAAGTAAPASLLGAVEGVSDAASGAAKLIGGWWTDRLARLKPLAISGYAISAVAGATLGAATQGWQIVAARVVAWTGRGIRTPARATLLAAGVPPEHFGKAFGLERALDTMGAVAGPLVAAALVTAIPVRTLLWWTLLPGLVAALAMGLLVTEARDRSPSRRPFFASFASLPTPFRRYLFAVGIFGLGDFAHSLLILKALGALGPSMAGAAPAAAIALYGMHNVSGALLSLPFGALGDRIGRRAALAIAYALGPLLAVLMWMPSPGSTSAALLFLGALFVLAGGMRAGESALESAVAAEMLPPSMRGAGFGLLAAVNSFGDLIASVSIGWLWDAAGPSVAFGAATIPMSAGALLLWRLARADRAAA